MAKDKTTFICNACGGTSPRWLGKCPSCGAWNSLVETLAEPAGARQKRLSQPQGSAGLPQSQAESPL
jgi:DNA repair protein RadA/Sms